MDSIDRQILVELQADGRMPVSALAEKVGLSEAPTWRRVKRLEEDGLIQGYHAAVDRRKLGLGVIAFVNIRFASHDLESARLFAQTIKDEPSVLSCHNVTGDVDYLMMVATRDLDSYEKLTHVFRSIPGVTAIETHLSLREVKHSWLLDPALGE